MQEAGLIERRPDPNDRRGTLVRLTRRGKSVIDRAVDTHVGNEERLLGALTATERRTLDALLRRLLIELERGDAAS
jgi:DNA-binding MarR family transcriptional regulator